MPRTLFILLCFLLLQQSVLSQRLKKVKDKNIVKWGYIESKNILNKMPEFLEARQEADSLLISLKKEFIWKKDSVQKEKQNYENIRLSLPVEERKNKEEELKKGEALVIQFKTSVFSPDTGTYFKKKHELMQVPLDKLFKAADDVAKDLNVNIFFDRDEKTYIIYINPDHDYSDYVMEKLGLGDGIDTIK